MLSPGVIVNSKEFFMFMTLNVFETFTTSSSYSHCLRLTTTLLHNIFKQNHTQMPLNKILMKNYVLTNHHYKTERALQVYLSIPFLILPLALRHIKYSCKRPLKNICS